MQVQSRVLRVFGVGGRMMKPLTLITSQFEPLAGLYG